MSSENSYRQILRSSSIIGGASVINILVGLLRMKVAAVLLGPAGVGLIGLLTNVVATASGVAGLGVGTVGTRQIAEAAGQDDQQQIWLVRRALFWLTLGLAALGGASFWMLRRVLAEHLLGNVSHADALGWLSVAVALGVAAASQGALLNGMRRIGDIARVSVWSAMVSTAGAIAAIWWLGPGGIVIYVLAAPVASFILGHWYVSRLPPHARLPAPWQAMRAQWRTMLHLGLAFMLAGLASTVGQLMVRSLVQRDLGVDALGHFQAAWAISMTYTGFVLGAMGTDFYPRLTALIQDPAAANRLVNEQTEVALRLAGPVVLAMLALAPWVIRLLYSAEFADAAQILRWQVLGDLLKVASWPLGFILLAAGQGKTFMATEWLAMVVFVAMTFVGLPLLGLGATGVAFLGLYVVYLVVVHRLARRRTGFAWSPPVLHLMRLTFLLGASILLLSELHAGAAAVLGSLVALALGTDGLVRLAHAGELRGAVGQIALMMKRVMERMGVWRA